MPVEGDQPYALLFGTPGLLSLLRGTPMLLDGPLALVLHAPVVARADKGVDVVLGPFARRRRASDVPVQAASIGCLSSINYRFLLQTHVCSCIMPPLGTSSASFVRPMRR